MKLTLLHLFLIGFMNLYGYLSMNLNQSSDVNAWIEVEKSGRMLTIEARVKNNANRALELQYKLETLRISNDGVSTTFQKGSCMLLAKKEHLFSQNRISVTQSDQYKILLFVYNMDQIVARDSVFYNGEIH